MPGDLVIILRYTASSGWTRITNSFRFTSPAGKMSPATSLNCILTSAFLSFRAVTKKTQSTEILKQYQNINYHLHNYLNSQIKIGTIMFPINIITFIYKIISFGKIIFFISLKKLWQPRLSFTKQIKEGTV